MPAAVSMLPLLLLPTEPVCTVLGVMTGTDDVLLVPVGSEVVVVVSVGSDVEVVDVVSVGSDVEVVEVVSVGSEVEVVDVVLVVDVEDVELVDDVELLDEPLATVMYPMVLEAPPLTNLQVVGAMNGVSFDGFWSARHVSILTVKPSTVIGYFPGLVGAVAASPDPVAVVVICAPAAWGMGINGMVRFEL